MKTVENRKDALTETFSLSPLSKDIKAYAKPDAWKTFMQDVWAGLSVSFLSIPQALAYAIVVGLPAFCGLAANIFGTAIMALLGSSRHLVAGPTNATVLLVQTATVSIIARYYPETAKHTGSHAGVEIVLPIIASLVFFIGLFQLMAASLKFGRVLQFVSQAVVIGYVAGSSFALTLDQLFPFFGVGSPLDTRSIYEKVLFLLTHLKEYHLTTLVVGVMSLSIYLTLQKIKSPFPTSITMLFLVTTLVYGLDIHTIADTHGHVLETVGGMGAIEGVMPNFYLPFVDIGLLNMFLPMAFAIALFGMLETTSVSKNIAAGSGQRLHMNQEIFGLGMSNFFLSFFGALPCSSSISRTVLNYESGARTRFAAFFSSIFVAIIVFFLDRLIGYIPVPALAALLLATAMRMLDFKQIKLILRATHSDALVLIITFLSCIFFSLHIAFYIGFICSIALYLRKAGSPEVVEYSYDNETEELRPMQENEKQLKKKVRIINVEGELFFGAVDLFQSALKAIAEDDDETKVFILRLKHVRDLDATACLALRQLHDFLRKSSRHLVVASLPEKLWRVLEKAQLIDHLGRDNLLVFNEANPHQSIELALKRAKILLEVAEADSSTLEIPHTEVR